MAYADALELADYRRQVAALYAGVRQAGISPGARLSAFRRKRDFLFASHPQSALTPSQKETFAGLAYYPYAPELRFTLPVDPQVDRDIFETELSEDGLFRYQRAGVIRFVYLETEVCLNLYWILGYGGGLYLPFRDRTNGETTFAGGRYLLDTIKYADLGTEEGRLVVDFNYAYNPSCAYHPRWHCPLAPPENWLPIAIPAGEQDYPGERPDTPVESPIG